MDERIKNVLELIAARFAGQREALRGIGEFSYGFEGWAKWEAYLALHQALATDVDYGFKAVGVERPMDKDAWCDLVACATPWVFNSEVDDWPWPVPHRDDIWIELKCQSTLGADPGGKLRGGIARDLEKVKRVANGTGLVLAVVVQGPHKRTLDSVVERAIGGGPPPAWRRTIFSRSLQDADSVDPTKLTSASRLAMLMAWAG